MGAPKQKWTEEEEVALRKGVERYGPGKWRAIQKDPKYGPFLTQRSNVDLKDKWRIMSRAEGEPPRSRKMYRGTGSRPQRAPSSGSEDDDEETAKKKRKRNILLKYGEMITEAIAALNETGGSSMISIAKYIEDNHSVPFNFRRLIGGRLKTMVEEGMLIKGKGQAYRLNDGTPADSFEKKVKVKTPRLKSDSERSRSKLELNPDGTKRQKTAEEAAKAAALAIAEAEAAAEAAEQAMREAELAEQEAAEAEAAAEAAAAAVRPPKKRSQKGVAALQGAAEGDQPEGLTAQLLGIEHETNQEGLRGVDAAAGPPLPEQDGALQNDVLEPGLQREDVGQGLMQLEGLREGWPEPQGMGLPQVSKETEGLIPPAGLEHCAPGPQQAMENLVESGRVKNPQYLETGRVSEPNFLIGSEHSQHVDIQPEGPEVLQSQPPVPRTEPPPSAAQANGAATSGAQNPEGVPQAEVLLREDFTQEQLEQVLSIGDRGDLSMAAIDDERGLGMPIDPSEKMEIDPSPVDRVGHSDTAPLPA